MLRDGLRHRESRQLRVAGPRVLRAGAGGPDHRVRLRRRGEARPRRARPAIASFWETILLGARSYAGGAFRPHAQLHAKVRLREGHFVQWLNLWCRTVDELFAGERAELAKAHAHRVAQAFLHRLEHLPSHAGPASMTTGLAVTKHGPRGR